MNLTYCADMLVPRAIYDEMERIVARPSVDVRRDGREYDEEVVFADGMRVAIQVCGPGDVDAESCWTQGVLYSPEGAELGFTPPGDQFGGAYHLEYGGTEYIVVVARSDDDIVRYILLPEAVKLP